MDVYVIARSEATKQSLSKPQIFPGISIAFFHQRWEDFGSFEDCVVLSQERLSISLYVVWSCDFYVLWTGSVSFQRNMVTTRGGVDEI